MSKHTEGIWKVFICDDGGQWTGWPLSIYSTANEKCVVRTGGQWSYTWDENISQAEAIANANLIAAAPDMLAALEAIIERWDTPLWKDVPHTGNYINAARLVVAKAKGE